VPFQFELETSANFYHFVHLPFQSTKAVHVWSILADKIMQPKTRQGHYSSNSSHEAKLKQAGCRIRTGGRAIMATLQSQTQPLSLSCFRL
jgi:hypothetical protein